MLEVFQPLDHMRRYLWWSSQRCNLNNSALARRLWIVRINRAEHQVRLKHFLSIYASSHVSGQNRCVQSSICCHTGGTIPRFLEPLTGSIPFLMCLCCSNYNNLSFRNPLFFFGGGGVLKNIYKRVTNGFKNWEFPKLNNNQFIQRNE